MKLREEIKKIIERKGRVLVVGLGVSGFEAALFLKNAGAQVVAVEREPLQQYRQNSKLAARLNELINAGVDIHFGTDGESVAPYLDEVALAVISPGVSIESAIAGTLTRLKIPVVSELELGIELKGAPAVIVTGSNGKTTTVTLLDAMLRRGGFHSTLCGNIGTPVIAGVHPREVTAVPDELAVQVVEASSYQLETCNVIKPRVAVLLNISENHLERHGTLERYLDCKSRVFARQGPEDFAVLNFDDTAVRNLAARLTARVLAVSISAANFSGREGALIHYAPREGTDLVEIRLNGAVERFDLKRSPLLGLHNRYNLAVAILVSRIWGVETAAIEEILASFQTLEHRLEFVPRGAGPLLINDSKSTTVASALAAFESISTSFPERQIVIMLGGLAKAGSWGPLMKALKEAEERVAPVICFGRDANIIASSCRAASLQCKSAPAVEQAFNLAIEEAGPHGIVLFSPGCASFDEFRDFEERGRFFKSLARSGAAVTRAD